MKTHWHFQMVIFCLVCSVGLVGCTMGRKVAKPNELVRRGGFVQAAIFQERVARKSHGAKAAEAWYRAGKLWLDPDNPRKSPERALTCFRRVKRSKVDTVIAQDTRLWISTLTALVSALESVAAFKDSAEVSKRLHPASSPPQLAQ